MSLTLTLNVSHNVITKTKDHQFIGIGFCTSNKVPAPASVFPAGPRPIVPSRSAGLLAGETANASGRISASVTPDGPDQNAKKPFATRIATDTDFAPGPTPAIASWVGQDKIALWKSVGTTALRSAKVCVRYLSGHRLSVFISIYCG